MIIPEKPVIKPAEVLNENLELLSNKKDIRKVNNGIVPIRVDAVTLST
tara:strand:- start:17 stop:160 length:144 start_codon:yes stop_codon:yes gene_type:complete